MNIATVIVTYNRLNKLRTCIEKTLEENIDKCVIVNNGSTDGSREFLESLKDERLHLINLPKNIGGAGGFHEGLKLVANFKDIDWIVCYDDDAYPDQGVIDKFKSFIKYADFNELGSVASAVYLPDGRISEMNRPSYNPFWHLGKFLKTIVKGREGFHVPYETYSSNQTIFVDASSFVGFFLKKEIIKHVGLPPKEFFLYGDDITYILRIRKAGFKHLFNPSLKFFHDCETLYDNKQIYNPMWKAYYTYRNGIQMYKEAAGGIALFLILPIKAYSWLRKSKYYDKPSLYRKLVFDAIYDGIFSKFDKSHEMILSKYGGEKMG
ncbi:MAG: glycosyltransferase [Candidatus Aenigmatarchaeota archaeon]